MNEGVWRFSTGRVGSSFLSAEPASRKGICRTGGTKNVGRGARQVWVRSPLPSLSVFWRVEPSGDVLLAACWSYPSCCVCAVRVEGRTTTAPGSRCSSRRCHAEEEKGSRGDAGGRDRPKDHSAASAGALTDTAVLEAVGGLTALPDTPGSSGQLETLAEGGKGTCNRSLQR
jgi:hypothetical protein